MCRRKRSRPSSRCRLTKKVWRFSAGEVGCDSAIGEVDAARLITNNCAVAVEPVALMDSALALIAVKLRGRLLPGRLRCLASRDLASQQDRWLCVPASRRVCLGHFEITVSA